MNVKILKLLQKDARTEIADIALLCGLTEEQTVAEIKEMEREGIICGYKGIIDWDKVDSSLVSAIIELKVTPKAELGFEEVAERISRYPEVESVSLMSGACDLIVTVKGRTFKEVSTFVSKELAVIDSVISTSTQFIMRKYKEFGVNFISADKDGRDIISL